MMVYEKEMAETLETPTRNTRDWQVVVQIFPETHSFSIKSDTKVLALNI